MDGAECSQTYQYMHGIDRDRGSRVGAAEARKLKWLLDRGQERECVFVTVDRLDYKYGDVSTSTEEFICQINARKIKGFVDDGPDVRVRCGGKDNYKYKNKSKITFLNGKWPETRMSSGREV